MHLSVEKRCKSGQNNSVIGYNFRIIYSDLHMTAKKLNDLYKSVKDMNRKKGGREYKGIEELFQKFGKHFFAFCRFRTAYCSSRMMN